MINQNYPEELCNNPTHIEGRTVDGSIDAKEFGQDIFMALYAGLICQNVGQTCENYEVRFCCPNGKYVVLRFWMDDIECAFCHSRLKFTFYSCKRSINTELRENKSCDRTQQGTFKSTSQAAT